MSWQRILEAARRLDRTLYEKTGLAKLFHAVGPKIPAPIRTLGTRYGGFVAIVTAVAVFAAALNAPEEGRRVTTLDEPAGVTSPTAEVSSPAEAVTAASESPTAAVLRAIAKQFKAPATANVCGLNGILATGPNVQYPYAVQCVDKFSGDNGGEVYRGVYRDKIRLALYVTTDPTINSTTRAAGGCIPAECLTDWARAFVEWFQKYYETYGRRVELVPVMGSGPEGDPALARRDAEKVKDITPPVFASLGGPGEAGPAYAVELKSAGIMCICTASLPQNFYEKELSPYVFSTLMSSTQAYIHRSQYIGERLVGRPAQYHGDPLVRNQTRRFAFIWFDNSDGNYRSGAEYFMDLMKRKYNVSLDNRNIRYENIQGCQINADNMGIQLAGMEATSVIFAGDPICPIYLTKQVELQQAKWEWIITGSTLTDTNALARLYDQNQWSRAFGVSMLAPVVKDESTATYRMFKEVRPNGQWYVNVPGALAATSLFFRGMHLSGPKLTPAVFKEAMARGIVRGGTATLPRSSFGPKTMFEYKAQGFDGSFWDFNSFDDMTEIWWDPTARDANGAEKAYRYVEGGRRYQWGGWPSTDVKPFDKNGTITGYEKAPDQ